MENYQRKRLKPLAYLVVGLLSAPLALAPVAGLLQRVTPAPELPRQFTRQSLKSAATAATTTVTPTTVTPTTVTTLEGMTLDAPIRHLRRSPAIDESQETTKQLV
ncbi:TPA: hypothetical protein MEL33_002984 [Klebsiella pneumoniae]|nr:hypothetical protein [Klebsiella pneumoniae]